MDFVLDPKYCQLSSNNRIELHFSHLNPLSCPKCCHWGGEQRTLRKSLSVSWQNSLLSSSMPYASRKQCLDLGIYFCKSLYSQKSETPRTCREKIPKQFVCNVNIALETISSVRQLHFVRSLEKRGHQDQKTGTII